MCLSVPREVIKVEGKKAYLQDKRWVRLDLVKGKVKAGDMLLVNADMAIEKVSKKRVKEMKEVMEDGI